jgi:DNA-binding NarL/FixJ family response regulator
MALGKQYHITILSEKTPRASSLAKIIRDELAHCVTVEIVSVRDVKALSEPHGTEVCILDCLGVDQSSAGLVRKVQPELKGIPLIVLHIYRSKDLVEPFYELGVMGYLNSEPTKAELIRAILKVADGGRYYPSVLFGKS